MCSVQCAVCSVQCFIAALSVNLLGLRVTFVIEIKFVIREILWVQTAIKVQKGICLINQQNWSKGK